MSKKELEQIEDKRQQRLMALRSRIRVKPLAAQIKFIMRNWGFKRV